MNKLLSVLVLLFAFIVTACGGSDNQQSGEAGAAETQASEARTIEVYGIDQMKFAVKEQAEGLQTGETVEVNGETYYLLTGINATTGEELTINLHTISQLPPSAMSHNWVLLSADADPKAFADASTQAKDNDYIAPDMADMVLTHTEMVGGGSSAEVTFTAPETAGDYPYLCSFPAHFSAGMKGTLSVQ